ncbi:MAG: hypothetical protein SOZ73_06370 [Campylobacter sp.]|nr:hypothetical protein [Campylobacter sp.]MDY3776834.1 hypothetical protein [Campylobacter sp.]MDY4013136.1 hypothetical protein [Campylobacter sp.]
MIFKLCDIICRKALLEFYQKGAKILVVFGGIFVYCPWGFRAWLARLLFGFLLRLGQLVLFFGR